jgi:hypothetical protein
MSKTDRPTPEAQLERALRGEAVLQDFLSEGDFVDVMHSARWRLIRVFATARTAPRKGSTPGYILGLDDRLASLATFVQRSMSEPMQRKIFAAEDLPAEYRRLNSQGRQRVVNAIRYELFVRILELMQEANELWRMEGEWLIPQSVSDEYGLRTKAAKASYRDDRSFHGRPRRDRGRLRQLRIAGGVSVGA